MCLSIINNASAAGWYLCLSRLDSALSLIRPSMKMYGRSLRAISLKWHDNLIVFGFTVTIYLVCYYLITYDNSDS